MAPTADSELITHYDEWPNDVKNAEWFTHHTALMNMAGMRDTTDIGERDAGYHGRIKLAKRRAALDAAVEVLRERGYVEATLQEIAARGGMSTATLFKHFPTKSKLFEAIVKEVWRFIEPIPPFTAQRDLLNDLILIGREFAGRLSDERTISIYRIFIAALNVSPELGQIMLERGKLSYVRELSAFLELRVPHPRPSDLDLSAISSQFIAMIADRVFWPRLLASGVKVTDDEVDGAIRQASLTLAARLAASMA